MFSIIIPLYNKAPYIAKAIQSVAAQTFQEFELIVIDDGSTDDSLAEAQKALTKLTPPLGGWVAVKKKNEGVSTTRNKGVELAKYDYIAFLDADDWWEPTFLEEMKALIDEFPDAGIYGSGWYKVRNNQLIPAAIGVEPHFNKGYINYFQTYARSMWMPLWTGAVIIPKTVYHTMNGFLPNLKMGEDFHLWVRIADQYQVAFVNKQLAYYNQDVEIDKRAAGIKLYEKEEHMLFCEYSKTLLENKDFLYLFHRLALYGLTNYYISNKHKDETNKILSSIDWSRHEIKYYFYYKILTPQKLKLLFNIMKLAVKGKQALIKVLNYLYN